MSLHWTALTPAQLQILAVVVVVALLATMVRLAWLQAQEDFQKDAPAVVRTLCCDELVEPRAAEFVTADYFHGHVIPSSGGWCCRLGHGCRAADAIVIEARRGHRAAPAPRTVN
jgi:hypothetical protein